MENKFAINIVKSTHLLHWIVFLPTKPFSHWLKLPAAALYKSSFLIVLATFSSLVCEHSDIMNPKTFIAPKHSWQKYMSTANFSLTLSCLLNLALWCVKNLMSGTPKLILSVSSLDKCHAYLSSANFSLTSSCLLNLVLWYVKTLMSA